MTIKTKKKPSTRKASIKQEEHVKQSDAQDFPKFFKDGTKFTRIDSKTKFIEVQLMKSGTSVRSGSNLHVVMESVGGDPIDCASFNLAFTNAMMKLSEATT